MAGLNRVTILGNLGGEPESRVFPDGNVTTTISVATSITWIDKRTNERKERTEWHRIVLFHRVAEIAKQYLHKGSKVYVEGHLQTRKYQDKQGNDKYILEIIGDSLQLLDKRPVETQNMSQQTQPATTTSYGYEDMPPMQDNELMPF